MVLFVLAKESEQADNAIRRLHQHTAELDVGIINVSSICPITVLTNSYVLSVVGIRAAICQNKSVCRIVCKRFRTVRQHIAVKVVAYGVTVKFCQTVVGIVLEGATRCAGNITCGIVSVAFFRKNNITVVLGRSLGYSTKAIISIAEFGISVKVKNSALFLGRRKYYFFEAYKTTLKVITPRKDNHVE